MPKVTFPGKTSACETGCFLCRSNILELLDTNCLAETWENAVLVAGTALGNFRCRCRVGRSTCVGAGLGPWKCAWPPSWTPRLALRDPISTHLTPCFAVSAPSFRCDKNHLLRCLQAGATSGGQENGSREKVPAVRKRTTSFRRWRLIIKLGPLRLASLVEAKVGKAMLGVAAVSR